MKKTLLSLATLCALSLPALPALANDASFGGDGANLVPIKNDQIRMVDEKVVLNGVTDKAGRLVAWRVEVDFTFQNESKTAQTIQMGFPFHKFSLKDGSFNVPPGKKFIPSMVYDFEAKVEGKKVKTKEYQLQKPKPSDGADVYHYAQIWDVTFKPNEKIHVKNSYLTGVTRESRHSVLPSYILKTGALWKTGKIGRSKIEIHPNVDFKLCSEMPKGSGFGPKDKPLPAGFGTSGEGNNRTIFWDLKDFKPKEDVSACIVTATDAPLIEIYATLQKGEEATIDELRIARNSLYARYGAPLQEPELKSHFSQKWWYHERAKLKTAPLDDEDQYLLKELLKLEKEAAAKTNGDLLVMHPIVSAEGDVTGVRTSWIRKKGDGYRVLGEIDQPVFAWHGDAFTITAKKEILKSTPCDCVFGDESPEKCPKQAETISDWEHLRYSVRSLISNKAIWASAKSVFENLEKRAKDERMGSDETTLSVKGLIGPYLELTECISYSLCGAHPSSVCQAHILSLEDKKVHKIDELKVAQGITKQDLIGLSWDSRAVEFNGIEDQKPEIVSLEPLWKSDQTRLQLNLRVAAPTAYASSDGNWSSYTTTAQTTPKKTPRAFADYMLKPELLSLFLDDHKEAIGYSEVPVSALPALRTFFSLENAPHK